MAKKSSPVFTDDGRQSQLINLAYDLAEQRLRDGTATSQEVTHFLKLGTEKSRLELDILRADRELTLAKTDAIRSDSHLETMYQEALAAMSYYSGEMPADEELY